ncbi:hypothetical protein [Burkholderia ubonensis]|uniref:hypothetical protein n=1 Tax=Burkholderia ubonensis TaxID=101571 RepID=UPI000A7E1B38|nr:hypothetical protein [Burkholderia ubonensis]
MANQEPLVANNTNTITMSMRELDRLKVVEAVVEGRRFTASGYPATFPDSAPT